jgi:two-component system chemotaxis response regulator CheB
LSAPTTPKSANPIRVMLIDDSAVVRGFITRILEADPDITVIYSAQNGEVGVSALNRQMPDIILLDIEMPVMDGITALPLLVQKAPDTKIIMCSTLTTANAAITMKALSLGAIDCIGKPSSANDINNHDSFKIMLTNKIKEIGRSSKLFKNRTQNPNAKTASIETQTPISTPASTPAVRGSPLVTPLKTAPPLLAKEAVLRPLTDTVYAGKPEILAIGSSTGGPNALFNVLKHCVGFDIPIVITQHMPATFTKILAEHITSQTGIPAVEAEDGMPLITGRVHVAAGGFHMLIEKNGKDKMIRLNDGPMENFCKPAVDPMLRSLIPIYGEKILTVILTGMGSDGMLGARDVAIGGGRIIAQDEATSVVWGMPGAAAKAGICSAILPIDDIGPYIRSSVLRK